MTAMENKFNQSLDSLLESLLESLAETRDNANLLKDMVFGRPSEKSCYGGPTRGHSKDPGDGVEVAEQGLASWTRHWKPALWNEFIEHYHYLGSSHLFGARVRYRGIINAVVAPLTHTRDTQRETPAAQGLDQPGQQGLYYCALLLCLN